MFGNRFIILLVVDDRLILSIVRNAFAAEDNGYDIRICQNIENLQEIVVNTAPDLVIIDIDVNKGRGFEGIKIIKESPTTFDVAVMALTTRESISRAYDSGADDFIRKPIDELDLIVRVKSTLSLFKLIQGIKKQTEALEINQKKLEDQKLKLEIEKAKTDELLLNILPYEIAEQLKNKGSVDVKKYRTASILFTDFKDFTKISSTLSPEEIIEELQVYFTEFDKIIGNHFLEKIKTIGDAYMCAGGLPLRNKSNPFDATLAALDIQEFIKNTNKQREKENKTLWKLRIGIHTGQVVAGVIGTKKFAYDIWGDAVNTASRMETSGEPDRVNISGDTYKYIKDYFICEHRGKIQVKNKGEIDMYFVESLKPEYRLNGFPNKPNEVFKEILSTY